MLAEAFVEAARTLLPCQVITTSSPLAPSGGTFGVMLVAGASVPFRLLVFTTSEPTI